MRQAESDLEAAPAGVPVPAPRGLRGGGRRGTRLAPGRYRGRVGDARRGGRAQWSCSSPHGFSSAAGRCRPALPPGAVPGVGQPSGRMGRGEPEAAAARGDHPLTVVVAILGLLFFLGYGAFMAFGLSLAVEKQNDLIAKLNGSNRNKDRGTGTPGGPGLGTVGGPGLGNPTNPGTPGDGGTKPPNRRRRCSPLRSARRSTRPAPVRSWSNSTSAPSGWRPRSMPPRDARSRNPTGPST